MTSKEWKAYRKQAKASENDLSVDAPTANTGDVLALLDQRDALLKAAKEVLRTCVGEGREREFRDAIKQLRAATKR